MSTLYVTLLAAGMGKRMQSDKPKVLHLVNNEAMIVRLIKQALKMDPAKILIVVGKFYSEIKSEIEKSIHSDKIVYVRQHSPLGTGDAVKSTLDCFGGDHNINNIILNGDVPLIQYETINQIYNQYVKNNSKMTITSISLENPTGNGRIIIDSDGNFNGIVEEKDCNPEQKLINLVNCGIYFVNSGVLSKCIPKITNNNAAKEYYLTDLVKIYGKAGNKIDLYCLPADKEIEIFNVNTKEQLQYLEALQVQ